ncbi:DUF6207 family protein [Streptomyces sp. NPDC048445]|uniref:DUF6207 family protein n=1 Tax=Streptomyces sp. NPDC048445 TaxID=3365553 RepID=UPI003714A4D7
MAGERTAGNSTPRNRMHMPIGHDKNPSYDTAAIVAQWAINPAAHHPLMGFVDHGPGGTACTGTRLGCLLVFDITAAHEAPADVMMVSLERRWEMSGITVARRMPGEPGVTARIFDDTRRPRTRP